MQLASGHTGRPKRCMAVDPKSSAKQIKTPPTIAQLVDKLLDDHIYAEIADILNERGFRPGGSALPSRGAHDAQGRKTCFFTLLERPWTTN